MSALEQAWKQCFRDIGGPEPPSCVWDELKARYSEPHRAYHTLQHLEECFGWFEQVRTTMRQPGEIAFALFYHDVIYDTHAQNNEEKSAELAISVLEEWVGGDSNPSRIASLILTTKDHDLYKDADAKLLVDIDLSILGSSDARFDEYEQQIRKEYDWVSAEDFREGRKRVLQKFLDRSAIFSTEYFGDRLEIHARANLGRSIATLQAL